MLRSNGLFPQDFHHLPENFIFIKKYGKLKYLLEVIDRLFVIDDHVQVMNSIEYHKQKQLISRDHDVQSVKYQEVH